MVTILVLDMWKWNISEIILKGCLGEFNSLETNGTTCPKVTFKKVTKSL